MTDGVPPRRGTALVTGASSGIGLALSRAFASQGFDLVVVARNPANLERATNDLRRAFPARAVRAVPIDLASAGAADAVIAATRSEGIAIDILVNNAGIGSRGPFAISDPGLDREMLQVNIVALTELTRLYLGEMLPRRGGRILNVASTAAFLPGPFMAIYYASKAYVVSFSEALSEELRGSGLSVTALCPGPVDTNFAKRAGTAGSRLAHLPLRLSADEVARAGYEGLMRGDRVVIPGIANQLGAIGARLSPHELLLRFARRIHDPV